jgi:3-oxoacyl-[acyl-carrier protein] reductase
MDLGLTDRNALVCASSRGLGFAAAEALAREGARVFLTARGEAGLAAAADRIAAQGGRRPGFAPADLSRPEDRAALFTRAEAALGEVDILVVNAGGPPPGPFEAHDLGRFTLALELAPLALAHLAALAAPGMKRRGFGRIVQIVSIAGLEVVDGLILSNMSRPAALGLGKALAWELGPHGVLLNSVCPGIFLTDRVRELALERGRARSVAPEQVLAELTADVPLGRAGDPSALGDLIAFLASPRNTYLNGAAIVLDGGKTRRLC